MKRSRTFGHYLATGPTRSAPIVHGVADLLEREEWLSPVLITEPGWSEEEIQAAIAERLQKVQAARLLLVLPATIDSQAWDARFGPPVEC